MAIDADKVPAAKPSASGLHLAAIEAAEMKQGAPGKVLFIDIRTRAEAMYVAGPGLFNFKQPPARCRAVGDDGDEVAQCQRPVWR